MQVLVFMNMKKKYYTYIVIIMNVSTEYVQLDNELHIMNICTIQVYENMCI